MDFILSKIISRPARTVDVAVDVDKAIDSISSDHEYMSFNICDMNDALDELDDEHMVNTSKINLNHIFSPTMAMVCLWSHIIE